MRILQACGFPAGVSDTVSDSAGVRRMLMLNPRR